MMKSMNQNQRIGEITVSKLSRSQTFKNIDALRDAVESAPEWGPFEWAARQKLLELDGGTAQQVVTAAEETPTDPPEVITAWVEFQAAEEETAAARDEWLSVTRTLEDEVAQRIRKARGNATEISRVGNWINAGQAEVGQLKKAFLTAEKNLKRARATYNDLKLESDRQRREQAVRVVHDGQEVSLQEYAELRQL